jgi:hypothetical protein
VAAGPRFLLHKPNNNLRIGLPGHRSTGCEAAALLTVKPDHGAILLKPDNPRKPRRQRPGIHLTTSDRHRTRRHAHTGNSRPSNPGGRRAGQPTTPSNGSPRLMTGAPGHQHHQNPSANNGSQASHTIKTEPNPPQVARPVPNSTRAMVRWHARSEGRASPRAGQVAGPKLRPSHPVRSSAHPSGPRGLRRHRRKPDDPNSPGPGQPNRPVRSPARPSGPKAGATPTTPRAPSHPVRAGQVTRSEALHARAAAALAQRRHRPEPRQPSRPVSRRSSGPLLWSVLGSVLLLRQASVGDRLLWVWHAGLAAAGVGGGRERGLCFLRLTNGTG